MKLLAATHTVLSF